MNILIILGTDRNEARSKIVANYVFSKLNSFEEISKLSFVDPKELNITYNNRNEEFEKLVKDADGFIVVSPEYNHSYPGTLKTFLDYQFDERNHFEHKPALFVAVSSGGFGGARMIESLISVCKAIGLTTIRQDINVSMVDEKIKKGEFLPEKEWIERFETVISIYLWYVRALKWGRENL